MMYLFTPRAFAGYSSCLPTEGWPGRVDLSALRRGGLPVLRRSPIQALTGPSVKYIDRDQRVNAKPNRRYSS